MTPSRLALTLLILPFAFSPAAAQHVHDSREVPVIPAELLERAIAIKPGLATRRERVSTAAPDAQAYYDQGLACLHAYVWIDAARSFHQALRIDPQLAMAYLGLSYAEWELNRPSAALVAFARARELAARATPSEQMRMRLRALELDALAQPAASDRLTRYRQALDQAVARSPRDVELLLLRGMADAPTPGDRGQGSPVGAGTYYERALAIQPDSAAAHHYLTHAAESGGRVDAALEHGRVFASLAPAVPHAHHMYGHNLRRVGRIDAAIAEFQTAYDLEVQYARTEAIPVEYDWHHQHNLDLLATSFQYQGRMKAAERFFRESFAIRSPVIAQEFAKREWLVFLIARGRPDEAIAAAAEMIAHPSPIVGATGHIYTGIAQVAARRLDEAAAQSNTSLRMLKSLTQGAGLVTPPFEMLQGEFFLATGRRDKGREMLVRVMAAVRGQPGPDEWTQALFTLEALAGVARAANDWPFAADIAAEAIEHDPAYAGAHYAAGLAAEHNRDRVAALKEFSLAQRYWQQADPDLPELAHVRASLRAAENRR